MGFFFDIATLTFSFCNMNKSCVLCFLPPISIQIVMSNDLRFSAVFGIIVTFSKFANFASACCCCCCCLQVTQNGRIHLLMLHAIHLIYEIILLAFKIFAQICNMNIQYPEHFTHNIITYFNVCHKRMKIREVATFGQQQHMLLNFCYAHFVALSFFHVNEHI